MNKTTGVLRVALIGLTVTLVLNLVGIFVFHRSAALFFTDHWWSSWFPAWLVWFVLAVTGFGMGLRPKKTGQAPTNPSR